MEDKMSQKEIDNLLKMLHGQDLTGGDTIEIINYTNFIKFSVKKRTCVHYAISENYIKKLLKERGYI